MHQFPRKRPTAGGAVGSKEKSQGKNVWSSHQVCSLCAVVGCRRPSLGHKAYSTWCSQVSPIYVLAKPDPA